MKKVIIITVTLLSLFSVFSLFRADFSTDIISMLPLEDVVIKEQYKVLSAFNSMNKVVVEISKKDSLVEWVSIYKDAGICLEELTKDSIFLINNNISPESFFELRNSMINNWPGLLSTEDSIYISSRLNRDSLTNMLDNTLSSLFTFSSSSADPFLLKNDPFGFYPTLLKRLASFSPSKEIRIRDGLLTNEKNDKILLITEFNDKKSEVEAKKKFTEIEKKISTKSNIIWMGAVRASLDNSNSIKRDINVTLPITLSMIFLICLLIYRNKLFGFITFIPTVLGILITFGTFAFFTNFSLIIVGFSAALMGITVDFAIHFLYHVDSVEKDPNPLQTVKSPILASAFTTAGAFAILYTSKIPALGQLGLITAFGIITAALLSILLLPLIIKRRVNKGKSFIRPSLLFKALYKRKKQGLPVFLLISLALIFWTLTLKLQFDGDPDNMNGMSKSTLEVEEELNRNWSGLGEGAYLTVSSKNFDSLLLDCEEKLEPFVKKMSKNGKLSSGESFTNILPSLKSQKNNRMRWTNLFSKEKRELMCVVSEEVCKKYNLPAKSFIEYVKRLETDSTFSDTIKMDKYPTFLKDGMLKNSIVYKDSIWIASLPVVVSNDSLWEFIDKEARKIGLVAVNDDILGLRIVSLIKSAFIRSALLIPVVIVLIIVVMLRDFKAVIQVFFPTLLAAGLTLGTMALLNVKVNIVTMMVFAFIFGLGIDYALLMYYMSKKEINEGNDFVSHGAASVTVAAATTLSGLGVLILAKHPVIVTLGITGLIGIISSYICAIVLVPYFVKKFK